MGWDVIKSGEWVSSLELESLSSAVEGVADVAAIGIPDEKWGERPLLLIVARDGGRRRDHRFGGGGACSCCVG